MPEFEKKQNERRPGGGRPFNKGGFSGRGGAGRNGNGRGNGAKKPAAPQTYARDAALRALTDVIARGAYASQAIDRQLTESNMSPEDKRLATSIFYAAVENRLKIAHILEPFVKNSPAPVINDILHIACAQILFLDRIPDHAAVDEAVKQTRKMKGQQVTGFVNVVLRNVIRARDGGTLAAADKEDMANYISVEYSVSRELVDVLIEAYGLEEAEKICAFRPKSHPLTLRPNLMTSSDEEIIRKLDAAEVKWEKGDAAHSFKVYGAGTVAPIESYRNGDFSIQGESSMLAAYAVQAKPGMNILDACAAPGGKSALMCEMMNGTGRVYAWDVHEHRVELIRAASRRLKLYNLRTTVRDASTPYESFDAFMDAVLVDAPCSGLGVMADKPDIRLKFEKRELEELIPLQRKILQNCAGMVKVGGLLVYSTCTIMPGENAEQVKDFLANNPQFAVDTDDSWLPEKYRGLMKDGMVQFMQHRDGLEGFFIARMRRKCL